MINNQQVPPRKKSNPRNNISPQPPLSVENAQSAMNQSILSKEDDSLSIYSTEIGEQENSIEINERSVVEGIWFSEILKEPRCRRKIGR